MALTIEEQHETNDLDHDILATREVTFICGHKRVYEDISACQKAGSTTAMTSIAACPCPVVPVNGCNRSPTFN